VNGAEEIEYAPIEVLGSIYTKEHVPVAYRVTFSASMIRLVGKTLKGDNLFPQHGTDAVSFLTNILNTGELTATLQDQIENKNVASLSGVRVTSKSFTVAAKGVVAESVTFVAIRMLDESETA
jgi:hypothetical protein